MLSGGLTFWKMKHHHLGHLNILINQCPRHERIWRNPLTATWPNDSSREVFKRGQYCQSDGTQHPEESQYWFWEKIILLSESDWAKNLAALGKRTATSRQQTTWKGKLSTLSMSPWRWGLCFSLPDPAERVYFQKKVPSGVWVEAYGRKLLLWSWTCKGGCSQVCEINSRDPGGMNPSQVNGRRALSQRMDEAELGKSIWPLVYLSNLWKNLFSPPNLTGLKSLAAPVWDTPIYWTRKKSIKNLRVWTNHLREKPSFAVCTGKQRPESKTEAKVSLVHKNKREEKRFLTLPH